MKDGVGKKLFLNSRGEYSLCIFSFSIKKYSRLEKDPSDAPYNWTCGSSE